MKKIALVLMGVCLAIGLSVAPTMSAFADKTTTGTSEYEYDYEFDGDKFLSPGTWVMGTNHETGETIYFRKYEYLWRWGVEVRTTHPNVETDENLCLDSSGNIYEVSGKRSNGYLSCPAIDSEDIVNELIEKYIPGYAKIAGGDEKLDTSIIKCEDDGEGSGIYCLLNIVLNIMTWGIGIAAVIGMSIAGISYLTSEGDSAKMARAKNRIVEIVVGLIVYALIWTFLNFLLPGGLF